MISDSKLIEIMEYLEIHGFNATLVHYNLRPASLVRYINFAKEIKFRIPKILLLDIEISPMVCMAFNIFQPVFSTDKILREWHMICWSAKWLFEPEIFSAVQTPDEAINEDDKRIAEEIYNLINQADAIVTYNGDKFDIKRLNTRFLLHKMPPPKNFASIDLYKTVKSRFAFTRSSLNYVSQLMFNKEKIQTDIELWEKCIKGDEEALTYMAEYCDNDVRLLEEAYVEIRPWIKTHPNMAILTEAIDSACPRCGSYNVKEIGEYFTPAGMYASYRCKDCGHVSRGRHNNIKKLTKKNLLR